MFDFTFFKSSNLDCSCILKRFNSLMNAYKNGEIVYLGLTRKMKTINEKRPSKPEMMKFMAGPKITNSTMNLKLNFVSLRIE